MWKTNVGKNNFCKGEKETIFHLFFLLIHTKIFWLDMERLIKKKLSIDLQLSGFDIRIHFNDHGIEKDKAYFKLLY